MPHPFKNLTEANDAFAALTTQHDALSAELVGAQSARDTFAADLETARVSGASAIAERDTFKGQVETLTAEVGALKPRAEKAENDLTAYRGGETARINAEVVRVLAAGGHRPLPVAGSNDPDGEPAPQSKLTPKQRLAASIDDKLSKK